MQMEIGLLKHFKPDAQSTPQIPKMKQDSPWATEDIITKFKCVSNVHVGAYAALASTDALSKLLCTEQNYLHMSSNR